MKRKTSKVQPTLNLRIAMTMWLNWFCVVAVCVVLLDRTPVNGQTALSTLRGTVIDSSGAVVPAATITLKEPATGVLVGRQPADSQGNYELISLKPGTYRLTCESPGFKPFTADDVILDSGQARRIDIPLTLGDATQQVTVTAGAALINTESGTIGGLFDRQQHADVPLIDIYPTPSSMLTTLPGIQGGTGSLRINGQNTTQQSQGMDGLINDQTGGQSNNPEFLQEVAATTVNAPAESPRVASYNMTTKRGGNEIHGMVYYKFFSSAFDARNPFAASRTPYLQHEWQIEMGGPIIKNRTFIYGTWFSQRIPLGSFATASVPTGAMRAGDFSSFAQTVKDPLTGQPFPGNSLPASRISPVSAQIQSAYYPLPTAGGLINNYPFIFPFNSDLYKGDWLLFRLDHNLTAKNSIYARWLMRRTPYVLQNGLPSLVWTRLRNHQQWAVVDTHVFSPSLVNTFRFGLATDYIEDGIPEAGITPPDGSKVLSQTGLEGSNPGRFTGQGFPAMTISGLTALSGRPGGVMSNDRTYTLDESVSKRAGRHIAKFGGTYQLLKQFAGAITNYGSFTFDGSVAGIPYADFLLGIPRQSSRVNPLINRTRRAAELGLYAQDTFRVSQRLTLEYGVRWDYFRSPTYDDGLMYTFDPKTGAVVVPQSSLSKVSPLYPGNIAVVARDVVPHSDLRNIRPRASLAWRLGPNLVLRGGYGVFTERIGYFTLVDGGGPFQIAESYLNVVQPGQPPLFQFPNPYPNNLALATVPSQSVSAIPSEVSNGAIHEFNATIEKELSNVGLRASFISIRSRGLNYSLNVNLPPPSLTPFTTSRRPFPQLVNVTGFRSDGGANFNAFQVEAKRRAGSFMFDAHYSYQRNLSNFLDLENPNDVLSHWANDAGTRRSNFVGTIIWMLPVGHDKRFLRNASRAVDILAGNWELYSVSYVGSGLPFSPSFSGSSPSNTGVFGGLPDLVGSLLPAGGRTHQQWFNPAAFAVPPVGRFGNALPNSILGPWLNVHHLSVVKKIRITERVSYTLTAAISNLFNHPTFTAPLSNISVPGTGAFVSTVAVFSSSERASPRQVTIKGRIEF